MGTSLTTVITRRSSTPPSSEISIVGASLVFQTVKNPPTMQGTRVRSLAQKDPLEKEMATPSSILAWSIPWAVAWQGTVQGVVKELNTTEQLTLSLSFFS